MTMDTKQRKKVAIRVGAGFAILLLLIGMGYLLFFSGGSNKPAASKLGESDAMLPIEAKKAETGGPATNALVLSPTTLTLDTTRPTTEFTITASGNSIVINDVRLPKEMINAISIQNIDCPAKPAALPTGSTCRVSVKLIGTTSVSTNIQVLATSQNTNGITELKQSIAVSSSGGGTAGGSTPSGQPITGGITTDQNIPAPAGTNAIPSQAGNLPPPANPASSTASIARASAANSRTIGQEMRAQYLQARRGGNINPLQPSQLTPAPRSPYASWNNLAIQANNSSYPTDMSRVLTPDKPITAVLNNIIDTRETVTAVATVDRDVYGNNGRTVVIPRGAKLIGTVGQSTERVGIAWKQLIRPDGVRFAFEATSGDAQGKGGIPGKINERLLQRYGYSLLPNIAAAGLTAILGGNTNSSNGITGNTQQKSAKAIAGEIITAPLQQIANDIYKKKSSMPIQITVPAGTRITVWSVNDLRLKPLGETDEDPKANQNGQRQGVNSSQGFQFQSQNQQQNNNQTQQQSQTTDRQGTLDGNTSNNSNLGTVDANGNYIPASNSAPMPGPSTTNTGPTNPSFPANQRHWR